MCERGVREVASGLLGEAAPHPLDVFSNAQVIGIQTREVVCKLDKC